MTIRPKWALISIDLDAHPYLVRCPFYSNYQPRWTNLSIGNFYVPTKVVAHGNELVDVSTLKKNLSPLQPRPRAKSLVVQKAIG